jgi:copper chaperone CopZ
MTDEIELTVDATTLLGGAVGAITATLWSTAPVFLSGSYVAAITSNQKLLVLLGSATLIGSLLYAADYRDNFTVPTASLYSGIAAFLIVGIAGYGAAPVAAVLQGQATPTEQLAGDNLREATLAVDGVVCQGCRLTVTNYLSSMDGVEQVDVDIAEQETTVIYDGNVQSAQALANADVFEGAYDAAVAADNQYRN